MVRQCITPLGRRDLDAHLQLAGVLLMLQASTQGKRCCANLENPSSQSRLSSTNKSVTSPSGEAAEGLGPAEGRKQARVTRTTRTSLETVILQDHLKRALGRVSTQGPSYMTSSFTDSFGKLGKDRPLMVHMRAQSSVIHTSRGQGCHRILSP